MNIPGVLFPLSYILQGLGFIFILYAWGRALHELRRGGVFPKTRLILFLLTTVALIAYLLPAFIALCYFAEGCFRPVYRDYLRLTSSLILLLYGFFSAYLYYSKEVEIKH